MFHALLAAALVSGLSPALPGTQEAAGAGGAAEQVVRNPDRVDAVPGPATTFTGMALIRPLTTPVAPGQAGTALVTFSPGARSHWHTHPAGQTLHVTEGCGWTQVEGGPVQRICAGDVVYAAPGQKHWHGAAADSGMAHLAITESLDGRAVDWLEPVTDAQYRSPAR